MSRIKPIDVVALDDYIIEIKFSNGEIRRFDCKPYLNGDWFSELLKLENFKAVRVSGSTVEWASGQDLCPDCLYDNSYI